jgi:hypothetical protein
MKTQKTNGQSLHLQIRNNRWKWMAGASAATAAGVSVSQAGTITINLLNNYISATGGNHLNADLTGDGRPDLTIAGVNYFSSYQRTSSGHYFSGRNSSAMVVLNGVLARAHHVASPFGYVQLGSRSLASTHLTASLMGSIPVFFRDMHINNGALTEGSLAVTVSPNPGKVQLDSLTYSTRENVPDQGSSLALLAMGAGGVLALRQWRAAQKGS